MNKAELLDVWCETASEFSAFFSAIDARDFISARGSQWSYARNVDHLVRSVAPVANAMRLPKFLLRILFGIGKTKRSYQQIHDSYKAELARGVQAPPKFQPVEGREQSELMHQWQVTAKRLEEQIKQWSESQLDDLRLPHPILGKITVREMLYFTDLHARHHLENCRMTRDS